MSIIYISHIHRFSSQRRNDFFLGFIIYGNIWFLKTIVTFLDSNLHKLVCSFKRVCRFLKLFSLPIIRLSFSLRCFVHDLYQSYPQIFQPTQMISFLVLSYTGTCGKRICLKNDPSPLSLFNFHKQVCATGSANG